MSSTQPDPNVESQVGPKVDSKSVVAGFLKQATDPAWKPKGPMRIGEKHTVAGGHEVEIKDITVSYTYLAGVRVEVTYEYWTTDKRHGTETTSAEQFMKNITESPEEAKAS